MAAGGDRAVAAGLEPVVPAAERDAALKSQNWFDYKLEHDPRFPERVARARQSLRAGKGVKLEDVQT
jgi:hypothetical protein